MGYLTDEQIAKTFTLIELAAKWHKLNAEIERIMETSGYSSERFEAAAIDLDDTRYEIMEIVLNL